MVHGNLLAVMSIRHVSKEDERPTHTQKEKLFLMIIHFISWCDGHHGESLGVLASRKR